MTSCVGDNSAVQIIATFEKTDTCVADPAHSYEVFIPEHKANVDSLPLLLIIDAHAAGKYALKGVRFAAEKYSAVIVASNLIQNGFPEYKGAIDLLLADVRTKYPVGQTVFIAGFSGGARMALDYASSHHMDGLVACGALAGPAQLAAVHCPIMSISGTDDFNFVETAQYLFQEGTSPAGLNIVLTHDSHAWPDSLKLADAIGFLMYARYGANLPEQCETSFSEYCEQQLKRIDSLVGKNQLLSASLIARNLSLSMPFKNDERFSSSYTRIVSNSEYKKQLGELSACLRYEMNARQPYLKALLSEDSLWWRRELDTVLYRSRLADDPFRADMYKRIKAFWGIACYSYANQAVRGREADKLERIIKVYRLIEPKNPDMLYFSSFCRIGRVMRMLLW